MGDQIRIEVFPGSTGTLSWTASWASSHKGTVTIRGHFGGQIGQASYFSFIVNNARSESWLVIHVSGIPTSLQAWIL